MEYIFMEYQIIEKKGYYIVKVLGKFNRKDIYSVRQNLDFLLDIQIN